MATHDQNMLGRFRTTRILIVGVSLTLGIGLLGSLPATAAPAPPPTPSTSTDAKAAWQNSSHLAEIASEQVNGARQAQVQADLAAKQAAAGLILATHKVTSARQVVTAATASVATYQAQLDAFANATFRGAQFSQLSVILTAKSAEDFLDESTVMNHVAQDTRVTMNQAIAAKSAAAEARSDAEAAESASAVAKTRADQASVAAAAATATATSKKAALDAAVASYHDLYDKLSAQEKAAAAAAAEKARQESLAKAAAAQAQAQADAVAAAKAVATPGNLAGDNSSGSTGAAAATPAAPIQGGDSAGQIAAAAAMTKIGFAYVYAGDGPDAYDCSGLTTWAWAQAGISIPRVSYEQANFPEVPLDQLQPGDLVTYYSPVSHVAIYVGGGMVVSAADEELGIIYVPVDRGGPDPTGHRVPRG